MRFRLAALAASLLATTGSHAATLPQFPPGSPWTQDITMAPTLQGAANPIPVLAGLGGFGTGNRLQIDFSFKVVNAAAGAPTRTINGYSFDDYYLPDCEPLGTPIPVPANAQIEGQPGLSCPNDPDGEDCHLLIVQGNTLYEAYKVNALSSTVFDAQCLAVWNLSYLYPEQGRGDHCTSADAAGFPIAPLLFSADEIKAGVIDHAIRFILPNTMIRAKKYVAPATHGTNTTGPATSGPYGFRMRLKASYPIASLSPAAQVVAKALQKYGMLMADGGNIALTAQNDTLSTVKWADVGFDANSLSTLKATDFEVIDYGTPTDVTFNCTRTQIIEP